MASAMNKQLDKRLVDEAMDAYVDWREECAGVWNAYERWARAPRIDAAGAFLAYRAALDREESASHAYSGLMERMPTRRHPTGACHDAQLVERGL
jgi:hypothetical protein